MKPLYKNAYREILRSPGRFLAILAIIVLGSGFFVGLRVSRDAMASTAAKYLAETSFHDFAVSTTLGLTDEEVRLILDRPEVLDAEGSVNTDAIVSIGRESEVVFSFYSLPERVDTPDIVEGRLPASADECLADSWSGLHVGDRVVITEDNDPDCLELFTRREFTVTGVATSPIYLNFERGSSAIGTGSVTAFCYVLPEVFDADYYTSVNIRCKDMPSPFSDAYDEKSEALEEELEDFAQSLAENRRNTVLADAEAELADAEAEYEDGLAEYRSRRADAERELADALSELEEAKKELEDAALSIEDGKRELENGWRELYESESEARDELNAAQNKLDASHAALVDAEKEYLDGKELYDQGLLDYNAGLEEYYANLSDYEAGEAAYAEGLALYEAGLEEYRENAALLEDARRELEAAKAELDEKDASLSTLFDTLAQLINNYVGSTLYADGAALKAALLAGDPIASMAVDTALAALSAVDPSVPASASELLAALAALEDGRAQYEDAKAQYDESMAALEAAFAELEAAREELEVTRVILDDAKAQLDAAFAELESAREELEVTEAQLLRAREELDAGWLEYNTGVAQLNDAREELNRTLADARRELEDAEAELEEAQSQYEDGLRDYNEGLSEYEDARAEADREFADAERELEGARLELEDAREEIRSIGEPTAYLLGRWANVGYVCFESDTSIVRSISSVFPLFFFLVAALMCVTTISRMVEEQRTQLGVLLALGYSRGAVMGKFLFYSGLATSVGCALGILTGSALIPLVVWQAYRIMYSFSDTILYYFDWRLSSITFALYLAAMLLVTWTSCRKELGDVPANIIRPKAPKSGKRVLLERVPFIWRHLSFLWKVTVRNIFRYKQRVFMMILGIAGCTALMLTGFGIRDSIQNVVDYQFDEISHYDFTVTFDGGLTDDERREFSESVADTVRETLFMHQSSFTATANRNEKDAELCAVDSEGAERIADFMDFHSGSARLTFPEKGEALVSSGLAEDLELRVGDELTLRNEDGGELVLRVSGVFDNYIYNYVYVGADTYAAMGAEPEINAALILKADGVDTGAAMAEMLGIDGVLSASASDDMRTRISSMMDSLIYIVLLTIGCAAALAFVVIYNLTNINITERIREIATVKVLGFYDKESALYVLRENFILTFLGAAAGIPLGIALNSFVVGAIDIDMISFRARILPLSYVISIALTVIFSVSVCLMMCVRLGRINTAEALKAAE